MPLMEFHISREARDRYGVSAALFSLSGNVVIADVAASRALAHRINQVRGAEKDPARAMHPGALFAMGLIDEASHMLIAYYRRKLAPEVMRGALAWFERQLGRHGLDRVLAAFVEEFPGSEVYTRHIPPAEWLQGQTGGVGHREIALEELILLWLANANPAFKPFQELFSDAPLARATRYGEMIAGLRAYFATQPPLAAQNLIDVLRAPALASPDSLSGQLAYIREKWADFIDAEALERLLLAADVLKEEELAIWMRFHPPGEGAGARRRGGPGFTAGFEGVPDYTTALHEYERFSADMDWMPNTVMIAKSTYVWLHQLSRWYRREIRRLDQIPDEELETLRRRGINALWLIGLWERSRASRTIKRLCGKEDAVASAYSLYDYRIADDLGGEDAYRNLRDRAWRYGVRLASDMVPNHMGIDSPWVIHHPEWFLSRPDSPYPSYTFEGPDLSSDGRIEIKIEDHYYNQTDAAVVFRRHDKWTGDTRFVYHGNDGTSFPWNDTAQLDYLNPAVREQVIQVILDVARKFPIIRFDAAMTLAKRHIQRLWFPAPGQGGAIPSRAEYSMPTSEFDRRIPVEFWREVVDRVAAEAPGTLLLAEAFWLMEGYFVRTLGMHRVYNSAFMVLLRDEENAHFRSVIKNTLEFDPGIMKRYVNFMSNPDERTAIDQFGAGDKYFGVATMMATLPGLPMFGHGQVEGFGEKYGMEYYRPRQDEDPNQWLIDRHQREIAPLLYNRSLFSESENFLLYDFWREDGAVDENVFAYSNRRGDQRGLVIYHNKFASTRGTIHNSAAYMDKAAGHLRQRTLAEGLALPNDDSLFLGYRDVSTGLEFLRRSSDLVNYGFSIQLDAFHYHVLLHWRELRATAEQRWDRLHDQLAGAGVPSLDEALENLQLEPTHLALCGFLDSARVRRLAKVAAAEGAAAGARQQERSVHGMVEEFAERGVRFVEEAQSIWLARNGNDGNAKAAGREEIADRFRRNLRATMRLPQVGADVPELPAEALSVLPLSSSSDAAVWGPALGWCAVQTLAEALGVENGQAGTLFDKLLLRKALAHAFHTLDLAGEDGWRGAARVRLLAERLGSGGASAVAPDEWRNGDVRWLAGVNEAGGHRYVVKEQYEQLLWWLSLPRLLTLAERAGAARKAAEVAADVRRAGGNAADAGYDLDAMIEAEQPAAAAGESIVASAEPGPTSGASIGAPRPPGTAAKAAKRSAKSAPAKKAAKKTAAPGKKGLVGRIMDALTSIAGSEANGAEAKGSATHSPPGTAGVEAGPAKKSAAKKSAAKKAVGPKLGAAPRSASKTPAKSVAPAKKAAKSAAKRASHRNTEESNR